MSSPLRTPAAKLDHDKRKLRGTKRPHDHDQSRRGYFAGLVDSNPKATTTELAAIASKQFEEKGDEPISEKTARRWKQLLKSDRQDFLAGNCSLRVELVQLRGARRVIVRGRVRQHAPTAVCVSVCAVCFCLSLTLCLTVSVSLSLCLSDSVQGVTIRAWGASS